MQTRQLDLIADAPKERLDKFVLAHLAGFSRTQVQALIRDGNVLVDGAAQKTGYKFKGGEQVTVSIPPSEETYRSSRRISRWISSTRMMIWQ